MQAIHGEVVPAPPRAARHADRHRGRSRVRSEAEERAEIALREIAAAGSDLAHLRAALRLDLDACADGEPVARRHRELHAQPPVTCLLPVLEERRHVVHVADHDVEVAVVVEIAHREAPAHLLHLQARACRVGHVHERAAAVVQQELVLLRERLAEGGEVVHVGEDVSVGNEQIEAAVEVGVEEDRAPAHADERRRGKAQRHGGVLEQAVAQVAIDRVPVVGERREDDVQAAVAVDVAGIGAHAGLGTGLAVDRDAGQQADALEVPASQVAVQEVRRGVVGHEQVHLRVVVEVGRDDGEAVASGGVLEAARRGGVAEAAVADVLEEQIRFAGQASRSHHDARTVAPDERAPGAHELLPRRADVTGDVQVEVAVGVRVEKRAARAPAIRGDPCVRRRVLERAVAGVAEQDVRPPVGHVEVEEAIAVHVADAGAVAPGGQVHARARRDVFKAPASKVPVERIAVRQAFAGRRELRRRDEVDVEPPVVVVVEEGDAGPGRLEDVVLGRTSCPRAGGQRRGFLELHRRGRHGGRRRGRCRGRAHRRGMAAGDGLARRACLAEAALQREPEGRVVGERARDTCEQGIQRPCVEAGLGTCRIQRVGRRVAGQSLEQRGEPGAGGVQRGAEVGRQCWSVRHIRRVAAGGERDERPRGLCEGLPPVRAGRRRVVASPRGGDGPFVKGAQPGARAGIGRCDSRGRLRRRRGLLHARRRQRGRRRPSRRRGDEAHGGHERRPERRRTHDRSSTRAAECRRGPRVPDCHCATILAHNPGHADVAPCAVSAPPPSGLHVEVPRARSTGRLP